jgi:hypothetical protein
MVRRAALPMFLMASLTLAAITACGKDQPAPATTPTRETPASTATASTPGPTADAAATDQPASDRVSATGIGPYVLGASLEKLKAAGSLTNIKASTACPDHTTADSAGAMQGAVHIVFAKDSLAWIEVTSPTVSTVDGAATGMAFDEIAGLYSGRGVGLTNGASGKAVGVPGGPSTGAGLLLAQESDGDHLALIAAGAYDQLVFNFQNARVC